MSLLTYGMIGDRLSDFVADLKEFTEFSNPDIGRVILNLDAIREECDRKVGEALAILRDEEEFAAKVSLWKGAIRATMGLNATDPMGLNSTTDMGLR